MVAGVGRNIASILRFTLCFYSMISEVLRWFYLSLFKTYFRLCYATCRNNRKTTLQHPELKPTPHLRFFRPKNKCKMQSNFLP